MAEQNIPSDAWRSAMGAFASGVTVVTSWDGKKPVGSTVSSFCSVSLEPPLLLVCINHDNMIHAPLIASGIFGVHILGIDSGDVAMRFAMPPETNRFDGLDFGRHDGGAPHIAAASVFIDCTIEQVHKAGTHDVIIGRGQRVMNGADKAPLLYHKGGFFNLGEGA